MPTGSRRRSTAATRRRARRASRDFIGWLARKGEADGKNLLELTQMVALITMLEGREADAADAVRLSTLHAAKGLEFPHVFLVGLEEGVLPHRGAVDAGNVDEERRLMYVGLTRAQQTLHLSYCRTRKRAGEKVECAPSRFLAELAQEDLRYADQPLSDGRGREGEDERQCATAGAEGAGREMNPGSVNPGQRCISDERLSFDSPCPEIRLYISDPDLLTEIHL